MEENRSASAAPPRQKVSSFRIMAALMVAAPLFMGAVIRHFVPQAIILWASALILGIPVFAVIVFAIYRKISPSRAGSSSPAKAQPKRSLYWYANQSERWRQSLSVLMIITIGAISGMLTIGGLILMVVSTSFMAFVTWLTPTISFLVVLTISIVMAFAGAAGLGPRLILLTTGRMPMGKGKRRA